MAQAYGARWVIQEDAVDSSLQAKSAMSTIDPRMLHTPGIDQICFFEVDRPGGARSPERSRLRNPFEKPIYQSGEMYK